MTAGRTVVIGVGNEFRRDDGVGPAVIAQLRGQVPTGVELMVSDGNPVRLIEAWRNASLAIVVDAVRADPPQPGRCHRFELDAVASVPAAAARAASTHGLGLDEALGLARVLGRMPQRLVVHAIEAADLTQGTGMTPRVAAAVEAAASAIRHDLTGAR